MALNRPSIASSGLTRPHQTTPVSSITRTLYVDGARLDSYAENGSIAQPFKTVQAAVNYAEANMAPTATNQVNIQIAPKGPYYDETVVIRKSGVNLIGSGLYDTVVVKNLIITNADDTSLDAFITAGGLDDPEPHYFSLVAGVSAPERNIIQHVDIGNGSTTYGLLIIGVDPGNAVGKGEIDFDRSNPTGVYARCVNIFGFETCTVFGSFLTNNVAFIFAYWSIFANGYTGFYDSLSTIPFETTNYGLTGLYTDITDPFVLNGEARLRDGNFFTIESLDLNDSSYAELRNSYVNGNITVEGDAQVNIKGAHVQGNITLDNTGGMVPCTFDGGRYMGTLTDAGSRLTRNVGN